MLFVVRCVLFVVWLLLIASLSVLSVVGACCVLFVAWWLLFVVAV